MQPRDDVPVVGSRREKLLQPQQLIQNQTRLERAAEGETPVIQIYFLSLLQHQHSLQRGPLADLGALFASERTILVKVHTSGETLTIQSSIMPRIVPGCQGTLV